MIEKNDEIMVGTKQEKNREQIVVPIAENL